MKEVMAAKINSMLLHMRLRGYAKSKLHSICTLGVRMGKECCMHRVSWDIAISSSPFDGKSESPLMAEARKTVNEPSGMAQ